MVRKIISGGQTGVDQAALIAAHTGGLEIGGWCPPGRVCDQGVISWLFSLRETPSDRSPLVPLVPGSQHTEWNVRDADATLTLQLSFVDDRRTENTLNFCYLYRKHICNLSMLESNAIQRLYNWILKYDIQVLNVAGPSEQTQPGVGDATFTLLSEVFSTLATE